MMSEVWLRRLGSVATAAILLVGIVCLANGARRVGRSFPGFLVAQNRIVVSIGRSQWSLDQVEAVLFAQVLAVDGNQLHDGRDLRKYVSAKPPNTAVSYRFRKGPRVFTETIPLRRFSLQDFLSLYLNFFLVGCCFSIAGWWTLCRGDRSTPAARTFFVFCQIAALVLLSGGDVYGPYWFTSLYFTAQCVTPVALLHFTSTYPELIGSRFPRWRLLGLTLAYGGALATAAALMLVMNDPALFLPLVYSVWLLTANAAFLYLARLMIGLWSVAPPARRASLRRALVAMLASGLVTAVILMIYPALKRPVSPILLVAPLALFPLGTAGALRLPRDAYPTEVASVRLRLSLLFLCAVETAFLIAVAFFWLQNSEQRVFDDIMINRQQQAQVNGALGGSPMTTTALNAIADLAQTVPERILIDQARSGLERGDFAAARERLGQLGASYRAARSHLMRLRRRAAYLAVVLVLGLVLVGIAQAIAFTIATQRWLIRPIDQLATATSVIATGDLSHRVKINGADEFVGLGQAINAMATSLGEIQGRIEIEQVARQHAAGEARDAERRRVARELHEGVLQDLTAVKLRLETECRRQPTAPLLPIVDRVIRIIADVRRVVDELRPPDMGNEPFASAIAAHARALTEANGIALKLDVPTTIDIPRWAARDVYRIAQEAVANAVRHAAPKLVTVQLSRRAEQTVVEISDDGTGFDPERVPRGSGLIGMRERAAALGANLEILTAPGRGTTVRLVLSAGSTAGRFRADGSSGTPT
jgi:signal transduction histidine kinase